MSVKPHARGSGDGRGPAYRRRRRRRWLLDNYGDGEHAPCFHCGIPLTIATLEVDRFPICGHAGGTYRLTNIVPSCLPCNRSRCRVCSNSPRISRPYRRWDDPPEEEGETA